MIYPQYDSPLHARRARRLLLGAAAALLMVPPLVAANAADWPGEAPLRGSFEPPAPAGGGTRWDGINFGAQFGAGTMNTDFGNSGSASVAYDFRNTVVGQEYHPENWTTLPAADTNGRAFGGFLGYAIRLEDTVIGIDVAYNKVASGFDQSASDYISRQMTTSDGFSNQVTITSQSQIKLKDYATLRGRVGYAFGQFMPYAFAGVAVGRFDYATTTRVQSSGQPPTGSTLNSYNSDNTYIDAKNNAFAAGFVGGLGIDVAVTQNVFLRAEWEGIAFASVGGIRNKMNTGRVGVGVRF